MSGMNSQSIPQQSPAEAQGGHARLNGIYLIMTMALMVGLYWDTARALSVLWNNTGRMTYTHGWVIAAISVWLLFRAGRDIWAVRFTPSILGALVLFSLSVAWLLSSRLNIQTVQLTLFPVVCWAALWTLYGFRVARVCGFACAYLLFAVPVWDVINPLLQWGTIFAVRAIVRIFSIPAFFEANTIYLPAGAIVVEGGCSGLNFFVAGMAIVVLYGRLNNTVHRFRLGAIGVALMVADNWLRVFIILLAGHLTDMQHYLVRVEHLRFGWVMFAVVMGIFFFIAVRMKQQDHPITPSGLAESTQPFQFRFGVLVAALSALLFIPAWSTEINMRDLPTTSSWTTLEAPSGWMLIKADDGWVPVFDNADAQALLHLKQGENVIDIYQAVFAEQRQGKKLAGEGNSALGELAIGETISADVVSEQFSALEFLDARGVRHLVWQGYFSGERWFHTPMGAQLWYGVQSLISRPVSGVVALHARCASSCDTERLLMAELAQVLPVIQSPGSAGD